MSSGKSFYGTDPNVHQSENTWFTPQKLIQNLGGLFDLDPCTVSYRPFDTAEVCIEYDLGHCGLEIDWPKELCVWMNPPYGKEIEPFIEKFKSHGNGIALVFARMGTQWMQDWIEEGRGVFFLRKRVRFIDKFGKTHSSAGADSCFLWQGAEARERIMESGIEGVFNRS